MSSGLSRRRCSQVDRVEHLLLHGVDQVHRLQREVQRLEVRVVLQEAHRLAVEVHAGAACVLSQASSVGSNSKQCGQAKLKNSTTSTVPGGADTGTAADSLV